MITRTRLPAILLVVLLAFAAACSSGGDEDGEQATLATVLADEVQPQPVPPQEVDEVVRKAENSVLSNATGDNFFTLTHLMVSLNETTRLEVNNVGRAVHNMHIAGPDGEWNTADDSVSNPDLITGGGRGVVEFTPTLAGSYTFRCDTHPMEMGGVIVVV